LFIREALYDKIAETISVNPSTKIEQQLDAIITKLNSLEKVTVVTQQPPEINDDVDLTKAERGLESIWNGME